MCLDDILKDCKAIKILIYPKKLKRTPSLRESRRNIYNKMGLHKGVRYE